ncbi:MAG: cytochrome, partial [Spirulinaceae cyanobacterium SM2_1_0]|nr:cytochrome [Spirulinaceae cyanobacterium SM2_1_0]
MPRVIIGVIGPGAGARAVDCQRAQALGAAIA